ncbi:hypothetical protein, partial [Lactobacillus gallinarum]|uniref:hypothetical protein n=1 Tax=Lactobacillus gallinarum TaxID=52242 RepID=UPI00195C076A
MKELRKTRKFRNRRKWMTATTITLGMSVGLVATNSIYDEKVEAASNLPSNQNVISSNISEGSSQSIVTKVPNTQVGALQQDSNRIYVHRYTEPTGVDSKGNFVGEQVISSNTDDQFTNPSNHETLGIVKKGDKVYYNIYDSEHTLEQNGNMATIKNPSSHQYEGYVYDDEFQKHVDPQRYSNSKGQVITNIKGQANINMNAAVPQQAYHIYYKNKNAQQSTYQLKSTDPNSYQFVFDWYEHDHGYYLGSTRINDYSKLTAKSLMAPYVTTKNTNDYLVKAPKGYHFDVEATHSDKVVSGEYGIDSDVSTTGHPYLDLNDQVAKDFGNEKAYDTGVFHVNEWAQAIGGLTPDKQNAEDIHIFRCYVTANKATKNVAPLPKNLPSQQASSLADPQSHLSDKDYRQVVVRIYDDNDGGITAFQIPVKNGERLSVPLQNHLPNKYKNYKLDPGNPANSSKLNNNSDNYLINDNFYKKYPDGITYFISNAPWAINNGPLPVITLDTVDEAAEKAKQEAAEKAKQEAAEKAKQEAAEKAKQEA